VTVGASEIWVKSADAKSGAAIGRSPTILGGSRANRKEPNSCFPTNREQRQFPLEGAKPKNSMMRIAILSDIHGNRTAFEAVLADLQAPDTIMA
jgi:hypothetical protein